MKLSVIVPVYNVEGYIAACIASLQRECARRENCEIIIVNDGSEDASMDIVRNWSWGATNVSYIDQQNGGLSSARNAGIDAAKGEYLWFIDSDDAIENGCLAKILETLDCLYDVIGYNMRIIHESSCAESVDRLCYSTYPTPVVSGTMFLCGKNNIGASPRFIFRRGLIGDLRFRNGLFHEDMDFNLRVRIRADKVFLSSDAPYRYLVRKSGSITSTPNIKRSFDLVEIAALFLVESKSVTRLQQKIYYRHAAYSLTKAAKLALHNKDSKRYFGFYGRYTEIALKWAASAPISALISVKTAYYYATGVFIALYGIASGVIAVFQSKIRGVACRR